jgi:type I restriction enzyme M protein
LLSEATNDKGNLTKATVTTFIKDNKTNPTEKESVALTNSLLKLFNSDTELKKELKVKTTTLDDLTLKKFKELTEAEVRTLVVDDKWLTSLQTLIQMEIDAISQRLTTRIKELSDRYENSLGELDSDTKKLEDKVNAHLEKMGLVWN